MLNCSILNNFKNKLKKSKIFIIKIFNNIINNDREDYNVELEEIKLRDNVELEKIKLRDNIELGEINKDMKLRDNIELGEINKDDSKIIIQPNFSYLDINNII
jgi:hypothetical protein